MLDSVPQVLGDNAQFRRLNPQPIGYRPLALFSRPASLDGLGPIPDDDSTVEFTVNYLSECRTESIQFARHAGI